MLTSEFSPNNSQLVSIVIPAFNAEKTIEHCVESVLRQTITDFELIVVDDGSTDNTGSLLDKMALAYERLRVVHQENQGAAKARMNGCQMAKGEWVSFVDADDSLPEDALSKLLSVATDDTDIVFGGGDSLTGECRNVIPLDEFRHLAVRADGCIGVPWGCLFRNRLLTNDVFDVEREVVMGEDYIFWLRLVFKTTKDVAVVYGNVYDKGPDNISNTFQWTADYALKLDNLRIEAIPPDILSLYFSDITADRIANLFAVALNEKRCSWIKSHFYSRVINDARQWGVSIPLRHRLFLMLPSRWLRKQYSYFTTILRPLVTKIPR